MHAHANKSYRLHATPQLLTRFSFCFGPHHVKACKVVVTALVVGNQRLQKLEKRSPTFDFKQEPSLPQDP
jgi:hypothetical protein